MTRPSPARIRLLMRLAAALIGALALPTAATAQIQADQNAQEVTSGGATFRTGDLVVTSPWTRATPGGARIAGGYLVVTNNGSSTDRFVGATSDTAGRIELHEMSMNDGVMKMRPLPDGLEIKPGETVELKSGGHHLMFMDLNQPLRPGDTFKAKLQFEKAGSLDVTFNVNALGATSAAPQR